MCIPTNGNVMGLCTNVDLTIKINNSAAAKQFKKSALKSKKYKSATAVRYSYYIAKKLFYENFI